MAVLKAYPTPEALVQSPLRQLTSLIRSASRGRLGEAKSRQLQEATRQSFGITLGQDAFTLELRLLIEQLPFIQNQVDELSTTIGDLMQKHQLILSMPGIGPTLGAAILGEIGDIHRSANAKNGEPTPALMPRFTKMAALKGREPIFPSVGRPISDAPSGWRPALPDFTIQRFKLFTNKNWTRENTPIKLWEPSHPNCVPFFMLCYQRVNLMVLIIRKNE